MIKENKYNFGLVSVSFRNYTPRDILQVMKETKLSCIEWGSDIHAPCNETEKLMEISTLQKEYGIKCCSYGTYFRLGQTPVEELNNYISAAKILGTNVLRLWCGTKSGKYYTTTERRNLINECRTASEIAERQNVILCMECHMDTYTENLSDAISLMKEINSENFRMYWQPFQSKSQDENLAYAEAIAQYTVNIHVFQWKNEKRFSLNEGIKEWQSYLSKFSVPRTLLLEFMPDDRIDSLEAEVKALKTIIGESI